MEIRAGMEALITIKSKRSFIRARTDRIFRSRSKTSQYSRATTQEPLIVNQNRSNNRKPPKKYEQPATIRGFGRNEQARNSAKWHTPRRNEMKKPSYDPYGAIDV